MLVAVDVAVDVAYDQASLTAVGGAVVFERWDDAVATSEYVAHLRLFPAYATFGQRFVSSPFFHLECATIQYGQIAVIGSGRGPASVRVLFPRFRAPWPSACWVAVRAGVWYVGIARRRVFQMRDEKCAISLCLFLLQQESDEVNVDAWLSGFRDEGGPIVQELSYIQWVAIDGPSNQERLLRQGWRLMSDSERTEAWSSVGADEGSEELASSLPPSIRQVFNCCKYFKLPRYRQYEI